eukprot:3831873-Lingulodinium_polyedra.AAC.1
MPDDGFLDLTPAVPLVDDSAPKRQKRQAPPAETPQLPIPAQSHARQAAVPTQEDTPPPPTT